jgi:hypothetical protein
MRQHHDFLPSFLKRASKNSIQSFPISSGLRIKSRESLLYSLYIGVLSIEGAKNDKPPEDTMQGPVSLR